MGIVSDFVGGIRVKHYRDHALLLSASPRFFYRKHNEPCLQMDRMIATSPNKSILDRKVNAALYYHQYTDFYDFSLVMGKFTGVYNLWGYQPLGQEMKKKLSSMSPDSSLVTSFLEHHFADLAEYFQETYNISADKVEHDISMMFDVVDGEQIYRSVVCRDVGKILVATSLTFKDINTLYADRYISEGIRSGQMVQKFDELCQFDRGHRVSKK